MSFADKLQLVSKLKERTITVNGTDFTVREMSGEMRDKYETQAQRCVKMVQKSKGRIEPDLNTFDMSGQRALIVSMSLVDDDTGDLAFDYRSAEDLGKIGALPASFVDPIKDAALTLNGLDPESEEDLEKKSESAEVNAPG